MIVNLQLLKDLSQRNFTVKGEQERLTVRRLDLEQTFMDVVVFDFSFRTLALPEVSAKFF